MLATLLLLTALSLTLSLLFTPVVRTWALRWNFVDSPDNKRKVHKTAIPRVGGVAIAAAYFGSFLAVAALLAYKQVDVAAGFAATKSIAPAAMLIFLIGLADDIFSLKPWHKFGVEVIAAVMVVSAGVHIQAVSAFTVGPALGTLGTIIWLVACTNALNLIDGLDGLAAGIALLATMTTFIASLVNGNLELAILTAPLAGALVGFLVFNFNPASIFLGDSGSLLLGFLLGCYSILWSGKSATVLGMTAPLIALAVPLLDTTLAIARRFLRGQPIFKPDRSHIHHRLLARGLTHKRAVLLLYVAAGIAGSLSLCLIWAHSHWEAVILATFVCGAIYGIQQLGYAEFEAVRRFVWHGALRREINAHLAVRTFEERLKAAETADDCWAVVQGASEEFGFPRIRMQLAGRIFNCHSESGSLGSWAIRIPISDNDWIELSHSSGPEGHPTAIVPFADTMRRVLTGKSIHAADVSEKTAVFTGALYETVASTVN
jgi:UDP-GlcNAc:undecaprenyl-phosphate/decaprenyl-phosphate GlcNAc-1-phosphate transferase